MHTKSSLSNNLVDFSRKSKILEKNEEFFHIEEWRVKRKQKSLQIILNSYLRLAVSYAKKYKSYNFSTFSPDVGDRSRTFLDLPGPSREASLTSVSS